MALHMTFEGERSKVKVMVKNVKITSGPCTVTYRSFTLLHFTLIFKGYQILTR